MVEVDAAVVVAAVEADAVVVADLAAAEEISDHQCHQARVIKIYFLYI